MVSPLVPSDIELVDVYPFLRKYESYVFREHTVVRVAVDDDPFIFRKFRERCYDTCFLCFRISVIGDTRDIDGSSYVFCSIFSRAPEIHDDSISQSLIHLHPQIMWTYCHSIFHSIVVEKWIGFSMGNEIENTKNSYYHSEKSQKK